MDRAQTEAIVRITAEYVAQERVGQQPHLSTYLARHAEYADAIVEFVAYYHAVEVDLPAEDALMPPLSEQSRVASERAWRRLLEAESFSEGPITQLLRVASKQHVTFSQLAAQLDLSGDMLTKLDQQRIILSTLPQELLRRLAHILRQPLGVVQTYLGFAHQQRVMHGVAESPTAYSIEKRDLIGLEVLSFAEAVAQSVHLSEEQRSIWHGILIEEGL